MTPLPLWLIRLCSLPQTSPEPPKPNPVRSPLSSPLRDLILQRIRESGPLTAAEFIDLALYHPQYGYYSTAPKRSGRRGDFITGVDIGPLFGEMLAVQLEEMWCELGRPVTFDLVEAGAGSGRLMCDVLDAVRATGSGFYGALRVTLVERSAAARAAHLTMLAAHAARIEGSREELPEGVEGAIIANELLDALPLHIAVRTGAGLREIYVTADGSQLREAVAELSTPRIAEYVERADAPLDEGTRIEVALEAAAWIQSAAHRLRRGFLILFDYGYDDAARSARGTLTAYTHHTCATDGWLDEPGERDITAHVDFTALQHDAEIAGLDRLGATDQTYFLMGLGIVERLDGSTDPISTARRRTATSLVLPEGLGGAQKVLVFGNKVGRPRLRGLSKTRLT